MAGLIAIIAGIVLIVYAIQRDKKNENSKWLKDWGFWVITILVFLSGIFSLNDSSLSSIFTVVMLLALLALLYWRIADRSKKDLHGKKRVLHTLLTVLFALVWFFIYGPISTSLQSNNSNDAEPAEKQDRFKNDKYINLDGEKIYYTNFKKYKFNKIDSSWPAATAKINSITLYKTEKGYSYGSKRGRKKVQGLLAINLTVKALKDIEISMDNASISIPNINEQHDIETKEEWDDLDKGISKTGTIYAPIYKLKNTNGIESLRFKFNCEQEDTDAEDFYHTYDMSINLN